MTGPRRVLYIEIDQWGLVAIVVALALFWAAVALGLWWWYQ